MFLAAAASAAAPPPPPPNVAVVAPAPVASAAKPSAKAVELVKLMKADRVLERLFTTLAPVTAEAAIGAMRQDPQTAAYLDDLMRRLPGGHDRLVALLSEEFLGEMRKGYPTVQGAAAALYDRHFTPAELDDMIRFFGSGTGAKFATLQPQLQAEMEPIGQALGLEAGMKAGPAALRRAEQEADAKRPVPAT